MTLHITLTKKHQKPTVLRCIRANGSSTYTKIQTSFEIHDIAHYVVEQHLNFSNAFYGLLAQGYAISDFELPRKNRPVALLPKNLPEESLLAEHLVNLLQMAYAQGTGTDIVLKELKELLPSRGIQLPESLNEKVLDQILGKLELYMDQWQNLKAEESLHLYLEVEKSSRSK